MATDHKKGIISTVLAAIFLLVGSACVFGCECTERNDFELEFALSKAVFSGEVIDLANADRDTVVTFRVGTMWKGPKGETIVVSTNIYKTACGFNFVKGENYLVFAYGDGSLRTSICTRTATTAQGQDDVKKLDGYGWSKPVNGLRARLTILPSDKADSPFCRVFIEKQNVSNVMGQKNVRFDPDRLDLQVTDVTNGKPLAPTNAPYDGFAPSWNPTPIPYAGSTRFQISFPGAGYRPADRVIVDMGWSRTWVIPPGGWYMLSGKLTIPAQKGDHSYMDWSGTLELPAVRIPRGNVAVH